MCSPVQHQMSDWTLAFLTAAFYSGVGLGEGGRWGQVPFLFLSDSLAFFKPLNLRWEKGLHVSVCVYVSASVETFLI